MYTVDKYVRGVIFLRRKYNKIIIIMTATAVAVAAKCPYAKRRNFTSAVHKYDGIIKCSMELLDSEANMHAYCIARKRPEGLSFDSGNNFFCCASPHLLFRSTYRRSRASNLLILTFFPHPKIENSPRMISSPY